MRRPCAAKRQARALGYATHAVTTPLPPQRTQADQARLGLDQQRMQQELQQKAQAAQQKAESDARKSQEVFQLEALRQQSESQRTQESNQMRYQMNTDDNQTAMRLASAEIASGEKVAVSTGTGINPNP